MLDLLVALLAVAVTVLAFSGLLLVGVPCAQVIGALRYDAPVPAPISDEPGLRASVAVLIPAHNEAAGIAETVTAIHGQLRPGDRLLVVADNCSDDTARIARKAGAEVVERSDAQRLGKGYALAFGVAQLAAASPSVLLICDADCQFAPGAIDRLVGKAVQLDGPVQGLYRMDLPEAASLSMRLRAFAWCFKNQVRALGSCYWGWPCQLMGTGFAMPWALARTLEWGTDDLVEDMKMGVDLALSGNGVQFCPSAVVTSQFPSVENASASQQKRWEHGHLATIQGNVPRLLRAAMQRRSLLLICFALDLAVPPLALLVALLGVVSFFAAVLSLLGVTNLPLGLCVVALLALTVAILAARQRFAADLVSLKDLLQVPRYVLRKLPLYTAFLKSRQRDWVRTERDP